MMLRIANRGATKTRMMYGAYLSSTQVKEYTAFLLERKLIQFTPETQLYTLTDKGARFLRASHEIEELTGVDSDRLHMLMSTTEEQK